MNNGNGYYQPPVYQPPVEPFRQWCKRGGISQRDKSMVKAAGWFIMATIIYNFIIMTTYIVDLSQKGMDSFLFSSANLNFSSLDKYMGTGDFETVFVNMFIWIFAVAMVIGTAFYLLMGIYILNYSRGWAITSLVLRSIGLSSILVIIPLMLTGFSSLGSFQIINDIVSGIINIVGFVLSLLAVNALSRAKKQWESQAFYIAQEATPGS